LFNILVFKARGILKRYVKYPTYIWGGGCQCFLLFSPLAFPCRLRVEHCSLFCIFSLVLNCPPDPKQQDLKKKRLGLGGSTKGDISIWNSMSHPRAPCSPHPGGGPPWTGHPGHPLQHSQGKTMPVCFSSLLSARSHRGPHPPRAHVARRGAGRARLHRGVPGDVPVPCGIAVGVSSDY
jgi:hypothetical protein